MAKQSHDDTERRAKQRKAQAERERETELEDIRRLMAQPWGRRIAWRLLSVTGVFRTSFTGNSTTFFNEGQRNVGLQVLADIHEVCPELYPTMVKELSHGGKRNADDRTD